MSRSIGAVYEGLKQEAEGKGVGLRAWLSLSVGFPFLTNPPIQYLSFSGTIQISSLAIIKWVQEEMKANFRGKERSHFHNE